MTPATKPDTAALRETLKEWVFDRWYHGVPVEADDLIAGPLASTLADLAASEQARAAAGRERDEARATNRDLHRRAQKADGFRQRNYRGASYLLNRRIEDRRARRKAEAKADALAERVAVLEAALRPFREAADNLTGSEPDHAHLWESPEAMMITVGDLRRASAALPTNPTGGRDAEA